MLILLLACAPEVEGPAPQESADTAPEDTAVRAALQIAFPVAEPERIMTTFYTGVDHDPEVHGEQSALCTNYLGRGFPWCYDEHDGSDFMLDGGFDAMDAGSATVVAVADGVVVETEDGNYDRCHATLDGDIDCDGYEMAANYVKIQHETGEQSWYWHLMKGSVAVAVGQQVSRGEKLGMVGSSGVSSMPHVHLELVSEGGEVIDPFAGSYSQEATYWCSQGAEGELPGGC